MSEEAHPILTPHDLVAGLTTLLEVETLDTDLYRGPRKPGGRGRVFGGQVIAQGLMAASKSTEPDRILHSLHAYFMRPGNENFPVVYRVVRDYDGGSFSTRRVIAQQQGVPILNMAASFHKLEPGLQHQDSMPEVPAADELMSEADWRQAHLALVPEVFHEHFLTPRPIEVRSVDPSVWLTAEKGPPFQRAWFRAIAPLGDDPLLHRAVLAYASDMQLLGTSARPHGKSWIRGELMMASLDHALWIHDDFRADEWMLYVTDSPWAGRGRGMNRGSIFAQDGRLIATVAQEGLIRQIKPKETQI
jgi:acyl-CoA thioesterase II